MIPFFNFIFGLKSSFWASPTFSASHPAREARRLPAPALTLRSGLCQIRGQELRQEMHVSPRFKHRNAIPDTRFRKTLQNPLGKKFLARAAGGALPVPLLRFSFGKCRFAPRFNAFLCLWRVFRSQPPPPFLFSSSPTSSIEAWLSIGCALPISFWTCTGYL